MCSCMSCPSSDFWPNEPSGYCMNESSEMYQQYVDANDEHDCHPMNDEVGESWRSADMN